MPVDPTNLIDSLIAGGWAAVAVGLGLLVIAMLVWAVWAVLMGKLVPRSTHENVLAAAKDALETNRLQAATLDELLEHARTTSAIVKALLEALPPYREAP